MHTYDYSHANALQTFMSTAVVVLPPLWQQLYLFSSAAVVVAPMGTAQVFIYVYIYIYIYRSIDLSTYISIYP